MEVEPSKREEPLQDNQNRKCRCQMTTLYPDHLYYDDIIEYANSASDEFKSFFDRVNKDIVWSFPSHIDEESSMSSS